MPARLVLPRPDRWPIDGVGLRSGPLVPLPDDLDGFVATQLGRNLPPGTRLVAQPARHGLSELGWPMLVRDGEVVDGAGQVAQRRVLFAYRFVDWLGLARVLITDPSAWQREQESLLRSLGRAAPDFDDAAASCLWEALSVDPR